ncbi:hypothetical protein [Shewanella violacea]|uniref:Uncharacterized protein n=1 Tax=Shewanella violacea (strain JCM 10179 / CIP 106290 / LMG 19151 / DSS12) TaxID=637905 RepID=D4ZAQ2_SHEVD|nr:hypothetical protein [Shewanella violacea]BAJ03097.1 hypothetical protein SVI_3126 [Shewanella violacea DSS12]
MVSGVIGGIIAVMICTFISSKVGNKSVDGQLKFGLFISGLAWTCTVISLACVYVLFFTEYNEERDFWALIGLIGGFGICAIYSFGEAYKVHGKFDEQSIEFHTPWTGSKNERWENLEFIKFNSQGNWYLLKFKSGAKIRLSALLGGHRLALEHLKSLGHDF